MPSRRIDESFTVFWNLSSVTYQLGFRPSSVAIDWDFVLEIVFSNDR